MAKKLKIEKHVLIPKHIKLSEKEKKELFELYQISHIALPKILKNDPTIKNLNLKSGDVVKIIRFEETSGETSYYRGVINA